MLVTLNWQTLPEKAPILGFTGGPSDLSKQAGQLAAVPK
jgi:hypothetical protein